MIDEIDFDKDNFADILQYDQRYNARAYNLLAESIFRVMSISRKNISSQEVLQSFKDFTTMQFGPLSYSVLNCWGLHNCSDIGEMMRNLVNSGRFAKSDDDNFDDFDLGYSFEEAFLYPFG